MSETRKEFAQRVAKQINYADLFGDPKDIKVESLWRIYAHNIFKGAEISSVQYKETKQAFFVGFAECFRVMSDISDKFDENKASNILTQLSKESNEFINSLVDRTLA